MPGTCGIASIDGHEYASVRLLRFNVNVEVILCGNVDEKCSKLRDKLETEGRCDHETIISNVTRCPEIVLCGDIDVFTVCLESCVGKSFFF